MKKAIGYVRVSTEQQAREGVSIDAQRAKIKAWCELNDYELQEIYTDAGISGYTMNRRPGLQKALAAIRPGMALVVYSLTRLARSTLDTLTITQHLSKSKADLVSLSEKLDTSGAAGKMLFRMLAVLSEFERDVTSERTTVALAYKKAAGEKYACVPFGFSESRGKLKPLDVEERVIADMRTMRSAGSSYLEIARHLNGAGIRGKKGGKWHASTVRYVLNRQTLQ